MKRIEGGENNRNSLRKCLKWPRNNNKNTHESIKTEQGPFGKGKGTGREGDAWSKMEDECT